MSAPPFPIEDQHHATTNARVACVTLGLSAYLDDGHVWAERGAAIKALRAFLDFVPGGDLAYYTTSRLTTWRALPARDPEAIVRGFAQEGWLVEACRPFLSLRVADDVDAPHHAFSYTEIDSRRSARAAVIEIDVPTSTDPALLFQFALTLLDLGTVASAVGGYRMSWNRLYKRVAFAQMHRWSRRFLGLDAQDADEMAWHARDALPGTNWLTVAGARVLAAHETTATSLAQAPWGSDVSALAVGTNLVVRAGAGPTLGDRNTLVFPTAYTDVARRLAPLVVKAPPAFWGPFTSEESTQAWFDRLLNPEGWT